MKKMYLKDNLSIEISVDIKRITWASKVLLEGLPEYQTGYQAIERVTWILEWFPSQCQG